MRKKWNTCIFAVLAAVVFSGATVAAVSGAEFTDVPAEVAEAEFEQDTFSDGVQLNEDGTVLEDGLEYQYIPETDSYKLVKGVDRPHINVPSTINGKQVTGIGENAFLDCKTLRGVVVNGPLMVEKGAFVNCPRLAGFTITSYPERPEFAVGAFDRDSKVVVTSIGSIYYPELDEAGIFHVDVESGILLTNSQHNLDYVDLDKIYVQDFDDNSSEVLVEEFADVIYRRAFYGCEMLQEVTIANGPVSIETKAFSDCINLQKVVIPATVTEIASDAFEGTDNVVIYAPKNSYALKFAKENGIAYKVLDLDNIPRPVLRYAGRNANLILLKWDKIPYADGYQLYRYNRDTKKYEKFKTLKSGDRLYYKTNLRQGKTEYYKVRAYCNTGVYTKQYSLLSKRVKVLPVPAQTKIRTVLAKYSNRLGIYWNKQNDADGYFIYRSEKEPYKGYKKVKDITNGSTTKYMDTGVKKGKTYYYRMRAYKTIDGKQVYGPLSDPYKVKCK